MMPRSLQNFMNAFTSSDYTMYPFATTNPQDFKNLQSVYLDATLKPLLKRSDFVQEGWRLGPENPLSVPPPNSSSEADDIVFKGVVYNEMKGQMSDANYLFYIRFMEQLIPSLNNSGGDPQKMTELTYAQLQQFHQQHYHPSNARIITYGDQPVQSHLETLGRALAGFEKVQIDADIKTPISLEGGAKEVTAPGPIDPLMPIDSQYKTSITWLLGDTTDIAESFALRIATTLLLDGYGSPMYQSLIESGLGADFTPNTGYDTSGLKGVFSVGLVGVSEGNVTNLKEVIQTTIRNVADKGLDRSKVQGLMHQLELGLKHKTATFGMDLVQRLKPGWFNGIDPFDALAWNKTVETFKAEYASNPTYLEDLLKKYLLVEESLTFTMVPTASYGEDLKAEEQTRLREKIAEAIAKYPSEQEALEDIRRCEAELQAEQEDGREQNLECLPSLKVDDIPRAKDHPQLRDEDTAKGNVRVQWYEAPTNGLAYFRAVIPFEKDELSSELRLLIPLFNDALLRIGTKDKSMGEIEDSIKLYTGGLSFGYHTTSSPFDAGEAHEGIVLAAYALQNNVSKMYELLRTVLLDTDFDSPKARLMIKELVSSSASSAMDAMSDRGHAYAKRFAEAGVSPAAKISEMTSGITQVRYIARLAAAAESETSQEMHNVMQKLKQLQAILAQKLRFERRGVRVALTCSSDAVRENSSALENFLSSCTDSASSISLPSLPPVAISNELAQLPDYPRKALLLTPFQISHIGLALPIPSYLSKKSAPFAVLAQILTHKLLHPSIREQGGAYGAGAVANPLGGSFGMYTYRDPNPVRSVGVMNDAGRWALEKLGSSTGSDSKEDITKQINEAKMLIFQGVDAPLSVADMGMKRFLHGIDDLMERNRRFQLLDVDPKQIRGVARELSDTLSATEDSKVRWAVLGKGFANEEPSAKEWAHVDMGIIAQAHE
jgi:Zn-dependent M16 (insulinase) family peptidase